MKSKIAKILLPFVCTSCSRTKSIGSSRANESVYSVTLTKEEYTIIYDFLKDHFTDFPTDTSRKINYIEEDTNYYLKISLAKNKLKIKHKSNDTSEQNNMAIAYSSTDPDHKIKEIKSKLEKIKYSGL